MNRYQIIILFPLLSAFLQSVHAQERREVTLPAELEIESPDAQAITPAELEIENPEEIVEQLALVEVSPDLVLQLLEGWTDKIILRRQDLPVAKISIDTGRELTKQEAVLALESLLTLNGIMLTDMGGRFMKAVPATNVNTHVPQMIIGSSLGRAPSQQIYAKLFKFDYLNAEQSAAPLIQPMLSQTSSVVPFPKSNALLVTDALINLQRIETILNEADKAQDVRETIEFIKLDFVQASEMQERIEKLIEGPLKSYLEGNTSVTADERTNQLILITHPGNISVIKGVIEKVDVDAAPLTSSEVFQLRQAKAQEVVPIIEDIISGQKEGREEDAQVARENQQNNNNNQNNRSNNDNQNNSQNTRSISTSSGGGSEANSSLQFSNFVGLAADERTNSIVAYGTQQDLKTLRELIEKIDIPLPQVRIEAIITEVTLNESQNSGITALGFTVDGNGDVVFGNQASSDEDDAITTQGGLVGTGFALNGSTAGVEGLQAIINASDSNSDVRILQTPIIVVSHNEEGVVNVSESRPIVTSSSSTLDNSNTNVRSSVEFRDIGIQLTVTPLIGFDGSVQMTIEQTVDSITGFTDIDGNEQPIIGRREATSTITVDSGEMIILGGLQENQKNQSNAYFPLLGSLPILKSIFGGSSEDYIRRDLVIFIRPTVLMTPDEAPILTDAVLDKVKGGEIVKDYIKNGTTGNAYQEGSHHSEDEAERDPFIEFNWPKF